MVAFVMFIIIIFVVFAAIQRNREEYSDRVDQVAQSLLSSTSVRTFIDSCVSISASNAFRKISSSGGFIPGLKDPKTNESINENVRFMEYYRDGSVHKAAYLLKKSPFDSPEFYPCSFVDGACGGLGTSRRVDGIHYCNFSLSNQEKLETCWFGSFQNILLDIVPNSLKRQLEIYVAKLVSECIDTDFFRNEMNVEVNEINETDIDVNVIIGTNSISFTVDIPLIIEFRNSDTLRTTTSSHIINTDFRRMHDAIIFRQNSPLRREWRNIFNRLDRELEATLALNLLEYDLDYRLNENYKDDLYILRHRDLVIDGEFYEFVFAVGNRKPAMSAINYAPNNPDCEVEVPVGTNVTIDPEFADPDFYDTIFVSYSAPSGWIQSKNILHKKVIQSDHETEIMVEIYDGEYRSRQPIRVCINNDIILEQDYSVELLYNYLGFNDKYDHPAYGEIQRISLEDPIKLIQGGGFSQDGTWHVGTCQGSISSSCVVFPGWTPCSEEFIIPIYSETSKDIKDYFDECNINAGVNKIRFVPFNGGSAQEVTVFVEECLPHFDDGGLGASNPYLTSNVCCKNDFSYVGVGDESIWELFCGNENLDMENSETNTDVFLDSANDFYNVTFSSTCLENRGNVRASNQVASHSESPIKIVENLPNIIDIPERRRCLGCGEFGTFVSNKNIVRFDFSVTNSFRGTFESYFFKENDPSDFPHVCNPNYACVPDGPGRGNYLESNYLSGNPASARLKCFGGCNWGVCDFAVDCVCTTDCSMNVPAVCDGKKVGEFTGTCNTNPSPDSSPYFPEICASSCEVIDSSEGIFKCDGNINDNDCTHCDYECDGRRAFDILDDCSISGNPGVMNICSVSGRVIDSEFGGVKTCINDPSMNCVSSQYCDGVQVGGYARDSNGVILTVRAGQDIFVDICNDNCQLEDSDICWRTEFNEVHSACHQKKIFTGFSHVGSSSVLDGYCTHECIVRSCGNQRFQDSSACRENPTQENCCANI